MQQLEHPDITHCLLTGYPSWIRDDDQDEDGWDDDAEDWDDEEWAD